jgi:hypothetical protein
VHGSASRGRRWHGARLSNAGRVVHGRQDGCETSARCHSVVREARDALFRAGQTGVTGADAVVEPELVERSLDA